MVTVRAPAKVNLHLSVGKLRADGFHDVTTVLQAVSLYDDVSVEPARRLTVTVTGSRARTVPTDADNLAVRAVRALAAHLGRRAAVQIAIRKSIPVAAGLAGGSADAAAALLAAAEMWAPELDRTALLRIAAEVGSDVPFSLTGGTGLATGRGEQVSRVLSRGRYDWVLAFATAGLSTPAVYAEMDRQRDRPDPGEPAVPVRPDELVGALRAGDPVTVGALLANDLQPPALRLRPQLARVLETGRDLGAVGAVVSGSGPTVALLARSETDAVALAAAIAGQGVCGSVATVHGPVPGARVVDP